ncbi:hypothetical protein SEA_FORZA_27 [Gordonia phage Forza]|uniref:Uncharacterized protein n=1 Tax=Gordonia phage Forza TaxID=2571247 RepID=A0A650EY88_9CAUD|nr:hypothetical protein PP303_gp027 [Gordonia phage Forza]QEM41496.1 hypothetical protein SEA_BOOPY_27 [Gordonia phage Boopy]QGT55020.1 hypothetical protein SEA_FORZA_27 [Gordonia phage Forza]UXE04169.1 hypothetical protein SEA_BLUENGOLD_25 [Gordonia phage BlueNGold]WBF03808.1 hypothetical protein SEA_MAREELIH_25 [Gordonia phage Mareelih]
MKKNGVEICKKKKTCILAAGHPGKHSKVRVSKLACPHNIPNFGPPCGICDNTKYEPPKPVATEAERNAEIVREIIKWAKDESNLQGDYGYGYESAQNTVLDIIDENGGFA